MSTWPVSGGVVVQDGVVYAAAGIAHYDGIHVYALEAASGAVKWYNDTSGTTSKKANHGVSLQGELSICDGELRFLGGGVHEEARYDLATGKCLNEPTDEPRSTFHTAFYAYFPDYGKYVSLENTLSDGRSVCYDCTYEGSWHGNLTLLPALPSGARPPTRPISRWGVQRRLGQQVKSIWKRAGGRFSGFIVSEDALVAAGDSGLEDTGRSFLSALNMEDGAETWREELPGPVVKGGLAADSEGRIFVSLENGQIHAFAPAD
jgi:outer membrane protein assembly factor BamB